MAPVIVLPFHQDQRLSDDNITLPAGVTGALVEPALPATGQWQRLEVLYDDLACRVASEISQAGSATVVTGDCLALLGTLAGAQRAGLDPSLAWFDAHGDVHTLASSTSGYLGGMALRMAMGGDADKLAGPLGIRPLPEERTVLTGARDLDPAEVTYLATSRVRRRAVAEIQAEDVPDGLVIVHVDADVIDPAELPGLRFPAPGGPSRSTVLDAVRRLVASGRVSILDVACPWLDPADDEQRQARRALVTDLLHCGPAGS